MGRGSSSQTASDKRYYDQQREGFRRIAEQAEKASFRSVRNRNIAETARAAEALVGTQRARDLLENKSLKALKDELEKAYGIITPSVISDIESAIEAAMANKPINYPMGSSYSMAEWLGAAEAIQDYNSYLHGYGYTDAEVAAALAYGQYLVRGNTGRKPSSRLPRGTQAVTVTDKNGRSTTYYEQNGMLMKSDAVGATRGTPVKQGATQVVTTLGTLYANAKENGLTVKTHSASEVKKANAAYDDRRKRNAREIANAETSGTRQSKKISRQSGRLKTTRRR